MHSISLSYAETYEHISNSLLQIMLIVFNVLFGFI